MNKHDQSLIISSTIVVVFVSKIADFLFPAVSLVKITGNSSVDVYLGVLGLITILILISLGLLFVVLALMKPFGLAEKNNSKKSSQ